MVVNVPITLPDNGTTINVKFPFVPYSVQVDIMLGTLRGLLGGKNALIESPTGTGKTLALLCAAGAFILHQRNVMKHSNHAIALGLPRGANSKNNNNNNAAMTGKKIRVVYASRTHSQLAQVVREFKACPYSKVLQMAVLGSREHLCVHSKVNSLPTSQAQNAACNALRADRGCRYFHGVANFLADEQMSIQQNQRSNANQASSSSLAAFDNDGPDDDDDILINEVSADEHQQQNPSPQQVGLYDIEELGNLGRSVGFCPYFYEREIAENADIVFLPYSYIFDAQVVTQLPFSLDGCSLILDEAHNVPSYLASSRCLSITPRDTGSAVQDCSRAFAHVESQLRSAADGTSTSGPLDAQTIHALKGDMDDFAALKLFLIRLEHAIARIFVLERALATQQAPHRDDEKNQLKFQPQVEQKQNAQQQQQQQQLPPQQKCVGDGTGGNGGELVKPGSYMLDFLANHCCNLNSQSWALMSDVIGRAIGRLNESGTSISGLTKMHDFFTSIFRTPQDDLTGKTSAYRFVVFPFPQDQHNQNNQNHATNAQQAQQQQQQQQQQPRNCLGFWCLDCSVGMQEISERVSSMILASGTLSPMPHFAAELGVPFPVTVQGGHVIQPNQLLSLVLRRGPSGVDLNSSYANRNNVAYSQQLGLALVGMAQVVPDGMIVFFPSYAAMNSALEAWKNRPVATATAAPNSGVAAHQTIWGMLSEVKPIHVEPRDTSESNTVVKEYRKAIDGVAPLGQQQQSSMSSSSSCGKGAILLAVCRGKVSEGLDFADKHGRAVVVTGLPFANHGDLFVRLKKAHITSVAEFRPRVDGKLFTGDDWYKNEAMRAVNQALGRVIRHKDDYGCVILADDRFASHVRALSGWVRKDNVVCSEFRDAYQKVSVFFAGWKAAEAAKKEKEAAERKKQYLEEKKRLMGMLGGEDLVDTNTGGGSSDVNVVSNRNREENCEERIEDLSLLAQRAAENAALTLRARQHEQRQQQQQKPVASNSVLTNLLGPSPPSAVEKRQQQQQQQRDEATSSSNISNTEIPAPAALRSRSIFQKATLAKPTASSNLNALLQHNHPLPAPPPPPPTPAPAPAPPQQANLMSGGAAGPKAAAEFCERLKTVISPEQYKEFRAQLRSLLQHAQQLIQAQERSMNNPNNPKVNEFVQTFREQVVSLQALFALASDPNARDQLCVDFGCFVPVNLRPLYAELIRRRQRE